MTELYVSTQRPAEKYSINTAIYPIHAVSSNRDVKTSLVVFVKSSSFAESMEFIFRDMVPDIHYDYDVLIGIKSRDPDQLDRLTEMLQTGSIVLLNSASWKTSDYEIFDPSEINQSE